MTEPLDIPGLVALLARDHAGAILLTDAAAAPGPTILACNPAFEALTGYAEAELVGRSPALLQGPRTERHLAARLGLALRAARPERVVLTNYRRGGERYLCEIRIFPLGRDTATGRPTHFLALEREVRRRAGRPGLAPAGRFVGV